MWLSIFIAGYLSVYTGLCTISMFIPFHLAAIIGVTGSHHMHATMSPHVSPKVSSISRIHNKPPYAQYPSIYTIVID